MTIIDRKQLKDQRNLTDTFIRKHDREMGGRGKPRRYNLALVDDFLHRYFREVLQRDLAAKAQAEKLHLDISTYIETARTTVVQGPRDMVGKGGRL